MARILLVEDDPTIREILNLYLSKRYGVCLVSDGLEAAREIRDREFDLILLDLTLPGMSGETLAQIADARGMPVMMLTAKSSEEDVLNGLTLGAVDYITKPFSPKILMAKIENFLKRFSKEEHTIRLSAISRTLTTTKGQIYLTPTETRLLDEMLQRSGRVFSREELIDLAWKDKECSVRIVDATIKNLRKKLDGSELEIKTVVGVGYTLEVK